MMNDSEQQIVNLIAAKPTIIVSEICKSTGLTPAVVNRMLISLRQRDIITRVGAKKNGHWEVVSNNQE
ncbi:MAG: winged helix-turn-helix transcriptional regulator [Paludibacteraceae bacterium]|nr:winged helix-turn-helix transcriptional regulator [Paludibacteraceae bacterium]